MKAGVVGLGRAAGLPASGGRVLTQGRGGALPDLLGHVLRPVEHGRRRDDEVQRAGHFRLTRGGGGVALSVAGHSRLPLIAGGAATLVPRDSVWPLANYY